MTELMDEVQTAHERLDSLLEAGWPENFINDRREALKQDPQSYLAELAIYRAEIEAE